ncbi:MAG: hypothetical protein ACLUHE_16415 [Christensenellales bacterium]
MNAGKLMSGQPGFVPCTPLGDDEAEACDIPTRGKHAVVIPAAATLWGKPMAMLLLAADATATICHPRRRIWRKSPVRRIFWPRRLGRPNSVTVEMIKPGAAVTDVGINRVNGELIGDVNAKEAAEKAAISTRPYPAVWDR